MIEPLLPSVTVIVPVYNGEQCIQPCINSLLAMDYPTSQYEILVVDNNSTDKTLAVLASFGKQVRVLQEPTQGAAVARNRGIRSARYDILAFTDADCEVDESWLRHLVEPFGSIHAKLIAGGKILAKPGSNEIAAYGNLIHDHERAIVGSKVPYVISMNMALRKASVLDAGMLDEEFLRGQDCDLSFRLRYEGYRFKYLPSAIVYHENEHTLAGLFHEGWTHGMWGIKLRKHHENLLGCGPRVRTSDYVEILKAFSRFVGRTVSTGQISVEPLCECAFRAGKKLGMMCGSVRFKYFSI